MSILTAFNHHAWKLSVKWLTPLHGTWYKTVGYNEYARYCAAGIDLLKMFWLRWLICIDAINSIQYTLCLSGMNREITENDRNDSFNQNVIMSSWKVLCVSIFAFLIPWNSTLKFQVKRKKRQKQLRPYSLLSASMRKSIQSIEK